MPDAALRQDERGFTLVELLVAIVIIGIIAVPLGNVVISYLHNTDATTARLSESHDAQISAAYFAADVASVGVRSTTYSSDPSAPYPLTQSIEQNAPATSGLFPCGTAATPNAVIRFGWDDYSSASRPRRDPGGWPTWSETDATGQAAAAPAGLRRLGDRRQPTPCWLTTWSRCRRPARRRRPTRAAVAATPRWSST